MVLKSANYTNLESPGRTSSSIRRKNNDIRNHYVCGVKRSHGDIYVYLELCKQKERDDELEFSRVPYSDPKQKRASARDGY